MQLSGRNGVNVQRILEQFDPGNNNTKLIGAQIFMLQKSHQCAQICQTFHFPRCLSH